LRRQEERADRQAGGQETPPDPAREARQVNRAGFRREPMSDFPARIRYQEALAIVRQVAGSRRLDSERIAIKRVDGRILAQDVIAPVASPAFDNSRMDGFALRHADLDPTGDTSLRIAGTQFAGLALD